MKNTLIETENFRLEMEASPEITHGTYFDVYLRGEKVATASIEDVAKDDWEYRTLLFPSPNSSHLLLHHFKDSLDKATSSIDIKALAAMYPRAYIPFYTYGNEALLRVDCILALAELKRRVLTYAETLRHPNYEAWEATWNLLSATECQVYEQIYGGNLTAIIQMRQFE